MKAANGSVNDARSAHPLFSALGASYGQDAAPLAMQVGTNASSAGFNTSYTQATATLVGGVDLVRLQGARSAFALGVASGYIDSQQSFATGSDAFAYSGAAVGLYASYRIAGLRVEASVRSDFLKARYAARWLAQAQPTTNLASTGVELDAGYRYAINSWLAVEPLASAAVETTSMGDLRLGASTARFAPADSGWANLGVRTSGQLRRGAYSITGAITARAWDEFSADNTVILSDFGPTAPLVDHIGGLSGELGGDLVVSKGDRAEGFVSATVRNGATQDAVRALAGFRIRW